MQAIDHLSLYLVPFADRCRVNTWNCTDKKPSPLGGSLGVRKDFHRRPGSRVDRNLLAYTGLLRTLSSLVYGVELGSNLVLESNKAFNRTIYHLHQELDFRPVRGHLRGVETLYPAV